VAFAFGLSALVPSFVPPSGWSGGTWLMGRKLGTVRGGRKSIRTRREGSRANPRCGCDSVGL
jgi:hypothetical protein